MTSEEFEAGYAARSGITITELHAYGRYAEPCDCDSDMCTGWAMGHPWEDAILEDQLRQSDTPGEQQVSTDPGPGTP